MVEMSKTILDLTDKNGSNLIVTAFVGYNGDASVQLTTRSDFILLSSKDVTQLIDVLRKRLRRVKGYRATD